MSDGKLTVGLIDYSQEKSSSSINVGGVTAVSLPGLLTEIAGYITALDAITLGTITYDSLQAYRTNRSTALPSSPNAQRERAFRVFYKDDTPFFDDPINAIPNAGYGMQFHFDIPTADFGLTGLFPVNSDQVVLTQTQIAAFIAAFESTARSPYGGAVEVTAIYGVGKAN